jgi:hypothetical protein
MKPLLASVSVVFLAQASTACGDTPSQLEPHDLFGKYYLKSIRKERLPTTVSSDHWPKASIVGGTLELNPDFTYRRVAQSVYHYRDGSRSDTQTGVNTGTWEYDRPRLALQGEILRWSGRSEHKNRVKLWVLSQSNEWIYTR